MRARLHLLIIITILAVVSPGMAKEKPKEDQVLVPKDLFFEPGGGIRFRYLNLREATGGFDPGNESRSDILGRFQVDLKMNKGEFFETFARLIHATNWGRVSQTNGDSSAATKDSFEANNGLFVNQAWGMWRLNDSMGLKFGRGPIVLGRGLNYGSNDWFNIPYSYDHFDVIFDWEYLKLSVIGAKTHELVPVTGSTNNPDPEENHYILELDAKRSDFFNKFSIQFAQIVRSAGSEDGGATGTGARNMQRFGLDVDLTLRNFFADLFILRVVGTDTDGADIKQSALDFNVGYMIPSWNEMKVWAGGHMDTGDDSATDNVNKHYDSMYYDVYGNSGRMDFIRWGNLTIIRGGFSINILPHIQLGTEYLSFARTEGSDRTNFGEAGSFINDLEADTTNGFSLATTTDIGKEIDIWLDYKFPSGVRWYTTIAAFMPGGIFTDATIPAGTSKPSKNILQVMTQLSIFF